MKNIQFTLIEGTSLDKAFPLMRELRTHLSLEEFRAIYDKAHSQDAYQLLGAMEGSQILGLAGFRILYDYVHGKHLYVDDLVVTASCRGQGLGAQLLKEIESIAHNQGMTGLRLCTGIDMESAQKFYRREGWQAKAVAFKKQLVVRHY